MVPSENEFDTPDLSDAAFKMLVIRMLTEVTVYSCKIKEEVTTMQSEIKKNIQGTKGEGKEIGTQINDLKQKEEINIQPEQNEETIIKKNEEKPVSYTHLTLPTSLAECRSRWSPYH